MTLETETDSVAVRLKQWAVGFNRHLAELARPVASLPAAGGVGSGNQPPPAPLLEAMRYALLGPGKRLRPFLLCRCYTLCGGSEPAAYPIAAAIECVHAFSLVHDDLPAMDDDDLRRGRPTTHVQSGEATAILAGDALLSLAFELIARHAPDDRRATALTLELARACGASGMIGGQSADVLGQGHPPRREHVEYIHRHKTACLLESACRMGAILADASPETMDRLGAYGQHLGCAFQIADDLLDLTSSPDRLGKATGKDVQAGKQTFPRCVGIEESRRVADQLVRCAIDALEPLGPAADDLRQLARFVVERTR
ncbi:MAG TPA: farnesyl diphosphate synthase [Phycisphaerae bacterium]|nr:farnesyl diphosphate synthase [Phycisphaerae bacterium]